MFFSCDCATDAVIMFGEAGSRGNSHSVTAQWCDYKDCCKHFREACVVNSDNSLYSVIYCVVFLTCQCWLELYHGPLDGEFRYQRRQNQAGCFTSQGIN